MTRHEWISAAALATVLGVAALGLLWYTQWAKRAEQEQPGRELLARSLADHGQPLDRLLTDHRNILNEIRSLQSPIEEQSEAIRGLKREVRELEHFQLISVA